MNKKFNLPRGTSDILPVSAYLWQKIETIARNIFRNYNYREIRTPIFEETELFARSMGRTSDVVKKQMLNLASQKRDKNDDVQLSAFSLRPENTASVVRSYIQNNLDKKERLSKLYYLGPMFRGERPQKGRLRQFHQMGVEAIGPHSSFPYLDAEVIALSVNLIKSFGFNDFNLKINTLGTLECKKSIQDRLILIIKPKVEQLCDDCKDRYIKNVFRVLDCKNASCQSIVKSIGFSSDWLDNESRNYYQQVKEALNHLKIQYQEDPSLVRGLDYYTHTVFEISSASLGSQNALGAGGRYNDLVCQLGGSDVGAVGFALGMERILLALSNNHCKINETIDLYFLAIDEESKNDISGMIEEVRGKCFKGNFPFCIEMSYQVSSIKSQMRAANKADAKFVAILGEEERKKKVITLKDMGTSIEEKIAYEAFGDKIISILLKSRENNKQL